MGRSRSNIPPCLTVAGFDGLALERQILRYGVVRLCYSYHVKGT